VTEAQSKSSHSRKYMNILNSDSSDSQWNKIQPKMRWGHSTLIVLSFLLIWYGNSFKFLLFFIWASTREAIPHFAKCRSIYSMDCILIYTRESWGKIFEYICFKYSFYSLRIIRDFGPRAPPLLTKLLTSICNKI